MDLVSVVILTMGDRPKELSAAIESIRKQQGVKHEIVLVVNGGNPDTTLTDISVNPLKNQGIPGGRNIGVSQSSGSYILFLDDDGTLIGEDVLAGAVSEMENNAALGAIALRILDENRKVTRRHHPRLRTKDHTAGYVTSFPGGASFHRKDAFTAVGGFCEDFFYGLEETDLSWRLYDSGWNIKYCPELEMYHPKTTPERHKSFFFTTARNRVWLSYRQLPMILGLSYILLWSLITCARNPRRLSVWKATLNGTIYGFQNKIGPRKPISWRTVITLTRLGRPPII